MDRDSTLHHPKPTAVLRGGPFDGLRLRPSGLPVITKTTDDGKTWMYRPTAEMDSEYPTLAVYVLDHAEGA
jgi:hypothetical protein